MLNVSYTILTFGEVSCTETFRYNKSWWRKLTNFEAVMLGEGGQPCVNYRGNKIYEEFFRDVPVGQSLIKEV